MEHSYPGYRQESQTRQRNTAETQRGMAIGQKLHIPSVRSRTAIYSYLRRPRGRGSFFRRKCWIGRNTSRNIIPPAWRSTIADRSHSPSMTRWREGYARTRRGDLLRALGSLEICLDAIRWYPERRFFLARHEAVRAQRETGSSKRSSPNCTPPTLSPYP